MCGGGDSGDRGGARGSVSLSCRLVLLDFSPASRETQASLNTEQALRAPHFAVASPQSRIPRSDKRGAEGRPGALEPEQG